MEVGEVVLDGELFAVDFVLVAEVLVNVHECME